MLEFEFVAEDAGPFLHLLHQLVGIAPVGLLLDLEWELLALLHLFQLLVYRKPCICEELIFDLHFFWLWSWLSWSVNVICLIIFAKALQKMAELVATVLTAFFSSVCGRVSDWRVTPRTLLFLFLVKDGLPLSKFESGGIGE